MKTLEVAYPLSRFTELASLSQRELQALHRLGDAPIRYRRRGVIRREGEPVSCIYLMLAGWVTASVLVPSGERQIMKIHIPGDMLGTPSMALENAVETLTALTDCTVAPVPLTRLRELFTDHPRLAALFLMGVQIERIALMDTIAAMGRTNAHARFVSFVLDLYDRLSLIGAVSDGRFELPLTQEQIGEALGISAVHANRTMRKLVEEGTIAREGRSLTLLNLSKLRDFSSRPRRTLRFNPDWAPGSPPSG